MHKILCFMILVHVLEHLLEWDCLATCNVNTADKTELTFIFVSLDGLSASLNLTTTFRVLAKNRDPGQNLSIELSSLYGLFS